MLSQADETAGKSTLNIGENINKTKSTGFMNLPK